MYKYLYEKDWKDWKDENITRKLFKNEDDLLNYMLENKTTLFNAGSANAEIRLFRVEEKE